MAFYIKAI